LIKAVATFCIKQTNNTTQNKKQRSDNQAKRPPPRGDQRFVSPSTTQAEPSETKRERTKEGGRKGHGRTRRKKKKTWEGSVLKESLFVCLLSE
jgi:hypothetical protein